MGWVYVEDEPQEVEQGLPKVRLIGVDGNAFNIIGTVSTAMKQYQKIDPTYNAKYMFRMYKEEAMAGDYDNLLQVTMDYCEVY